MKIIKSPILFTISRLSLLLIFLSTLMNGQPILVVHAATLTVANTNDSGAGSLRQAILDATSGDTIAFDITGTITLSSPISINKNLTINGPGEGSLTLSGNNANRVFTIQSGNVTVTGLTIANGKAQGANGGNSTWGGAGGAGGGLGGGMFIASGSQVTIDQVTFSNNAAQGGNGGTAAPATYGSNTGAAGGAGYSDPSINADGGKGGNATSSTFGNPGASGGYGGGGGGGGYNAGGSQGAGGGTLGFGGNGSSGSASQVRGGHGGGGAGLGGAIFIQSSANVTIYNTAFSSNSASLGSAGGSGAGNGQGKGAGIFAQPNAKVETYNLSFSGNSSSSSSGDTFTPNGTFLDNSNVYGTFYGGPVVTNVTATNSNGTYGAGSVIYVQVVFSKSVSVTGTPQLTLETGTIDAVVDYSGGSGTNTLTFSYTVASGESSSDLDYASSLALSLNGGSIAYSYNSTQYNAFLTLPSPGAAGSLGSNKDIVIDTRQTSMVVTTLADENDGAPGLGTGDSLREAISLVVDGGTITFAPSLVNGTITLGSELLINKSLTILATFPLTVSGGNSVRVFHITGGTVNLSGLTISNGYVNDTDGSVYGGGGVFVEGASTILNLENCAVLNNRANGTYANYSGYGGGLLVENGTANVTNCTFNGNVAQVSGGAIADWSGSTINVKYSTITGNDGQDAANNTGTGGIYLYDGSAQIGYSILAANTGAATANQFTESTGSFSSLGFNLSDTNPGNAFTATGDLPSKNMATEIKLGSLTDNGGPTFTYALQTGSLAIDAIPTSVSECNAGDHDQRYAQRANGANAGGTQCDIGAFEVSSTFAMNVAGTSSYRLHKALVEVTTLGNLSMLTVLHTTGDHPNRTGSLGSSGVGWGEYWTFTPNSGASGFTVNMTLPHNHSADDANTQICRYTGGAGAGWDCARSSSTTTTVTRTGITGFSDWAVGYLVNPTAVLLSKLSAYPGRSTNSLVVLLFFLGLIAMGGVIKFRRA
jgi:CSLREA domain-containing protein